MMFASEESLFRSVEKRAKDPPGRVYRYHPVDLIILATFVLALVLVLVGFCIFEIKFTLGGYFFLAAETPEAANTTEGTTANVTTTEANATTAVSGKRASARWMFQEGWRRDEHSAKDGAKSVVCSDKSCRALARYVRFSLKHTARPCENFYDYVCSTWSLGDKRETGEAVLSEGELRRRDMEATVLKKLKSRGSARDMTLFWTRRAFQECTSGKSSATVFQNIMERLGLAGFPFSSKAPKPATVVAKAARLFGLWPLFTVGFDRDPVSKQTTARLRPPTDIVFRDFLAVPSSHETWFASAVAAVAGGIPLPAVLNLERRVTQLANTGNASDEPVLMNLSEQTSDKWNWSEFLRTLFDGIADVSRASYLSLENKAFAEGLTSLLSSFNDQDIANFIGFRTYLKYGILERRNTVSMLHSVLHPGWKESITRDEACLRLVSDIEPFFVMYVYWDAIKDTLDPSLAGNIVDNAKNTVLNFIENLGYIPGSFKRAFEGHLANMTYRYLVPRWLPDERMRKAYFNMVTSRVRHAGYNIYTAVTEEVQKNSLRSLSRSGFKVAWNTHPFSTDVEFINKNTLELPMGLFSRNYDGDAFWLYHLPRMGPKVIVALLKAYEETARLRDKALYQDIADTRSCLETHYLKMRETQVPDVLTSNSTLHDEVHEARALKLAFALYRSYVDPQSHITLEGLPKLNSGQLFFVNYALGRCESYDSRYAWELLRRGKKPPAAYRVNGPLRNSVEFAETFKCPVGSYMNPEPKCPLWRS